MLALRPVCENCGKQLPPESTEAMICTFECTFCQTCVEEVLQNVCPNCGGGFSPRPVRPKHLLEKNPPTSQIIFQPVDPEMQKSLIQRLGGIPPHQR